MPLSAPRRSMNQEQDWIRVHCCSKFQRVEGSTEYPSPLSLYWTEHSTGPYQGPKDDVISSPCPYPTSQAYN